MKTIFLLMWAADAVSSVTVIMGLLLIAYAMGLLIFGSVGLLEENLAVFKLFAAKWWAAALLCVVAIVTPSKETLHLIAAAKAGEVVVTGIAASPIGIKASKAIESGLDRIIREAETK